MTKVASTALRVILVVIGGLSVLIGLNVGFGGIQTLGWQGETTFFQVTNEAMFLLRDNHTRYFGGLYTGLGLFLVLAATRLRQFETALKVIFVLIFMGGLARLTALRPDIVFGPTMLVSSLTELVLMPILYVWVGRTVAVEARTEVSHPSRTLHTANSQ